MNWFGRALQARLVFQRFAVDALEGRRRDVQAAVGVEGEGVELVGVERHPHALALRDAHAARLAVRLVVGQLPEVGPQLALEVAGVRVGASVDVGDFARRVDAKTLFRRLVLPVQPGEQRQAVAAERVVVLDEVAVEFDDDGVDVCDVAVDGEPPGRQR